MINLSDAPATAAATGPQVPRVEVATPGVEAGGYLRGGQTQKKNKKRRTHLM